MEDDIQRYWNDRAREQRGMPTATTNDLYLRKLEAGVLSRELNACDLPPGATVADLGCGDGRTTISLAKDFPELSFHGIDFSPEMIASARLSLAEKAELSGRVIFSVGDVRSLGDAVGSQTFSAIVGNRCLINIVKHDQQYAALKQIAAHLQPGGMYLATENFNGGQVALNSLREQLGLPKIAVRWHNTYFDEIEFCNEARKIFKKIELINFSSSYYLVTRVVYSALCKLQGDEPDYRHPIHQVAIELPPFGDFSPIKLIRALAQ